MHYWAFVKKSFENIRKHPALLLPETLLFIATYFLTIGLYRFSGLSEFMQATLTQGKEIDPVIFLKSFVQDYTMQIIVSLAVFVFVTFILGAGTEAIKFRMIKKAVLGEKVSIRDVIAGRAVDFYRIVAMKIIIYLIALAIALCLMLLASFVFSVSSGLAAFAAWISAGIGIALFVILSIGLLFRYPILFLDNKNAATTVRNSFHYFISRTRHVLVAWLIYIGMAAVFSIASALATLLFANLQGIAEGVTVTYLVSFAGAIAAFAVRLVYNVWAGLFLFENYKAKGLSS